MKHKKKIVKDKPKPHPFLVDWLGGDSEGALSRERLPSDVRRGRLVTGTPKPMVMP